MVGGFLIFKKPNVDDKVLRIAIAPYQDLAMIVNAKPLGLEEKYGTQIEIVTLNWEDILPSIASAGRTVDIGFGSYIEYLTKYSNLNDDKSDPVLFIYPAYVFRGGAFVSFDDSISPIDDVSSASNDDIKTFLSYKIGAQKSSIYEMALFRLSELSGTDPKTLNLIDTPLDQGFLAAEQSSLDIATAGLTQLTEVKRRGGKVVLVMDDLQFADVTGFLVKESTWINRRVDVENAIRMWFDCVDYVYEDIDVNSAVSLEYLNAKASTRYTLDEYKAALSQEYLPRSIAEVQAEIVSQNGRYPYKSIGTTANQFLVSHGIVDEAAPIPIFPDLSK